MFQDCTPSGSDYPTTPYGLAATGLELANATVTLLHCRVMQGVGIPLATVVGPGTLAVDTLTSTLGRLGATTTLIMTRAPKLRSPGLQLGAQARIDIYGTIGLTILAMGLPGPPLSLASVADSVWLSPVAYEFAAWGPAPLSTTVTVPNNPLLRDLPIGWQAVSFTSIGIEASNPWIDHVR